MVAFNTNQPAFKDLRSIIKERTNPIVAWIGAGLSRDAKLPSWQELKEGLADDLLSLADAISDARRRKQLLARLDAIRAEPDYWCAFSNLQKALGKPEFMANIRRSIGKVDQRKIPDAYNDLWKLRISGMLTLNIDGFAKRSFASVNSGKALIEFNGNDIQERVLKNNTEFVGNLHGCLENDNSWVFTKSDLHNLLENSRYRTFINTMICTRTLLFLGITMDDPAVSKHFEFLHDIGFKTGDHFWLTNRSDLKTAKFAENLGIRPIYFDAPEDDYSAIGDFFRSIALFLPQETEAPPACDVRKAENDTELRDLSTLCKMEADDIRWEMNLKAADILSPADQASYRIYDEFCDQYNEAIYRAWYVDTDDKSNTLLGYKLLEEVKHPGAFGRVFRASNTNGQIVAIKVLHESIRRDAERLQSFRRGARAMKILTDHKLPGMVRYHEACEIPAMVVMDWIEGMNLNQAVKAKYITDWIELLRVGSELAQIIRSAHKLPERVLHRDVRPPNIMMENICSEKDDWSLKVLDFDLSWHKDSLEKSISSASAPTGYLAPEQLLRKAGVSTRNAAVDSFGVGMTLFFLLSRRDPMPNEHVRSDWSDSIRSACFDFGETIWSCIPCRIRRLIIKATKDNQHDRCDMAFIERELTRLHSLECGIHDNVTTVVLMEEIVAKSQYQYSWDSYNDQAILKTRKGLDVTLKCDEIHGIIMGNLRWSQEHHQEYQSIKKYLPKKANSACKFLKNGGWSAEMELRGSYGVTIRFHTKPKYSLEVLDKLANTMSEAVKVVSMVS